MTDNFTFKLNKIELVKQDVLNKLPSGLEGFSEKDIESAIKYLARYGVLSQIKKIEEIYPHVRQLLLLINKVGNSAKTMPIPKLAGKSNVVKAFAAKIDPKAIMIRQRYFGTKIAPFNTYKEAGWYLIKNKPLPLEFFNRIKEEPEEAADWLKTEMATMAQDTQAEGKARLKTEVKEPQISNQKQFLELSQKVIASFKLCESSPWLDIKYPAETAYLECLIKEAACLCQYSGWMSEDMLCYLLTGNFPLISVTRVAINQEEIHQDSEPVEYQGYKYIETIKL
ncbi:MAG: hypothetical protein C4562_05305 [Actinobacteria bacterium]|nr:MAG: hypothetical protein C4562_05305 [Actinomycetota bacterium]